MLAPIHRAELCAELQTPGVYPTYAKNITTAYDDTKAGIAEDDACRSPAGLFEPSNGTDPYTGVDILAGIVWRHAVHVDQENGIRPGLTFEGDIHAGYGMKVGSRIPTGTS